MNTTVYIHDIQFITDAIRLTGGIMIVFLALGCWWLMSIHNQLKRIADVAESAREDNK